MKKRVNPNKVPLSNTRVDIHELSEKASDQATLIAWAEILGALADFPEMTSERIWQLWTDTNKAAGRVHNQEDVESWIEKIEEIAGIQLPYSTATPSSIHTRGELDRVLRRIERKAVVFAYAIIGRQFVERELLPLEDVGRVFYKANELNEEIADRRITLGDLLEMLKDEYGLGLAVSNTGVKLVRHGQRESK